MMVAKPSIAKAKAVAVAAAPPPPLPEDRALLTVFLEDVPLLDSPEWSSDDELDNPTYNKRFRHKKHEEIRQRLQQKKLEERERQLQLAKEDKRTPTHQPGLGTEETEAATTAPPDPRTRQLHLSSGRSSRVGSQPQALERTRTGCSKRSRRSNNSRHSHHRHRHPRPETNIPSTTTAADAERSVRDPASVSSPAALSPDIPVVQSQPAPPLKTKSGSAAVDTVASVPKAALVQPPTSNKQVAPATLQELASGGLWLPLSQKNLNAHSPCATPSQNGTPQQAQELPIRIFAAAALPQQSPGVVAQTAKSGPRTLSLPDAAVAAFSSTEVQPPKVRPLNSLSTKSFASKIVKGGGGAPKHTTATPAPSSPSPSTSLSPTRAATGAAISASTSTSVVAKPAVTPSPPLRQGVTRAPQPFAPVAHSRVHKNTTTLTVPAPTGLTATYPSGSNVDDVASVLAGLDTTHAYIELSTVTEDGPANKKQHGIIDASNASPEVDPAKDEQPAAPLVTPAQRTAMQWRSFISSEPVGSYIPVPPLSPPPASAEPQRVHRHSGNNNGDAVGQQQAAAGAAIGALRCASRVDRPSSRLSSPPVSAPDRQQSLHHLAHFSLSRMQSYYQYTMEDAPHEDKTSLTINQATTQVMEDWERSGSFHSCNADYSIPEEGGYEYNINEAGSSSEDSVSSGGSTSHDERDSKSWGDVLSPTRAVSDIDYILEYHSSYYGDWLKLTDTPPSRETLSAADDSEKRSEVNSEFAEAPAKLDGDRCRRREAPAVHFHESTGAASKSTSKVSTSSTCSSSPNSLNPDYHAFNSSEMPGTATVPVYSFYTHFQTQREAERKHLDKDLYPLDLGDTVKLDPVPSLAVPVTAAAAVGPTKLPPVSNGKGLLASGVTAGQLAPPQQGDSPSTVDDGDLWAYHRARRELRPSLTKPATGAAAGHEKSSPVISKYSPFSSKQGLSVQRESKSAKLPASVPAPAPAVPVASAAAAATTTHGKVPPHGPAAVHVLSLQGPSHTPQPHPTPIIPLAALRVKPFSLENFDSQTESDSKSFDLLSPMTRKTTAQPEELVFAEEERNNAAPLSHLLEQLHKQQQQQPQKQRQLSLFSFAGLQYHPPATFQEKSDASPAASARPSSAAHTTRATDGSRGPHASPPASRSPVLQVKSFFTAPQTAPPQEEQSTKPNAGAAVAAPAQKEEHHEPASPPLQAAKRPSRIPSPASRIADAHTLQNTIPHTQSPHEVYLPIAGAEVNRFRSLIGSAYLTDVYTSSLRLLTSRRRPETQGDGGNGTFVNVWLWSNDHAEQTTLDENTTAIAAESKTVAAPKAFVEHSSLSHPQLQEQQNRTPAPPPPAPQRNSALNSRSSNSNNNPGMEGLPIPFAQPSMPSFGSKTLAPVSVEGSLSSSRTVTTDNSRWHRYRRRRHATRIDVIFEEAVLRGGGNSSGRGWGSSFLSAKGVPASPVRVAAQDSSGCGADSHHVLGSVPASQASGRLLNPADVDSRGFGAACMHSSAAPARSGGSFVRLVTTFSSLSPSPSQFRLAGASTAKNMSRLVGAESLPNTVNNHSGAVATPPASVASNAPPPLSVSALVKRLEANVSGSTSPTPAPTSQRPPLTVHSVASSVDPAIPLAESNAASLSDSNIRTLPLNRPASVSQLTPRNLNSSRSTNPNDPNDPNVNSGNSNINSALAATLDRSVATTSAAPAALPLGLAASISLDAMPKHVSLLSALDPDHVNATPEHAIAPSTRAATAPGNLVAINSPNHSNTAQQQITPAAPRQLPVVPRLTREVLMLQQKEQRRHGIVRDQTLPPTPQHPVEAVTSTHQSLPVKARGRGVGAAGGCRTTEDLLTRITVLDRTWGWRGSPDSSIVSWLGSGPLTRRSTGRLLNTHSEFDRERGPGATVKTESSAKAKDRVASEVDSTAVHYSYPRGNDDIYHLPQIAKLSGDDSSLNA